MLKFKKIYIDFTGGVLGKSTTKYHGGGSFSRWIAKEIISEIERHENCKTTLLWPKNIKASTSEEADLLNRKDLEIQEVSDLTDLKLDPNSILFIPLIPSYRLRILKKIKKSNPRQSLYIVIHGVRNLDLVKYDKYDKYYYSPKSILRFPITNKLYKLLKYQVEKFSLKQYLKYADKVFTVSNYSLQKIVNNSNVKYIKPLHQKVRFINSNIVQRIDKSFILFVAANKPEKNFIRTLIAFCDYKKMNNDDLHLYVTGVNETLKMKLYKIPQVSSEILDTWVVLHDYVSSTELSDLYKQCSFLLYTSKSEGYGIPPMEACLFGRPVVASYLTSIPEVLGAMAHYVNPYDINSICVGIEYMYRSEILEQYSEFCIKQKSILLAQQDIDASMIIQDIISD